MGASPNMILVVFVPYLVIFGQPAASEVLQVESGAPVLLPCSSGTSSVVVLQWVRPDLKADGYVFFYRDGHLYPSYQHKLFSGRVELSDPQMKSGNVSVVLKNVSAVDNGEYICQILISNGQGGWSERRRITLEVKDKTSKHHNREAAERRSLGVHVHPPTGLLLLLLLLFEF